MTSLESNIETGKAVSFFEKFLFQFFYTSDDKSPARLPDELDIFSVPYFSSDGAKLMRLGNELLSLKSSNNIATV